MCSRLMVIFDFTWRLHKKVQAEEEKLYNRIIFNETEKNVRALVGLRGNFKKKRNELDEVKGGYERKEIYKTLDI